MDCNDISHSIMSLTDEYSGLGCAKFIFFKQMLYFWISDNELFQSASTDVSVVADLCCDYKQGLQLL